MSDSPKEFPDADWPGIAMQQVPDDVTQAFLRSCNQLAVETLNSFLLAVVEQARSIPLVPQSVIDAQLLAGRRLLVALVSSLAANYAHGEAFKVAGDLESINRLVATAWSMGIQYADTQFSTTAPSDSQPVQPGGN